MHEGLIPECLRKSLISTFTSNEIPRCPCLVDVVPTPFFHVKLHVPVHTRRSLHAFYGLLYLFGIFQPMSFPEVPSFSEVLRCRCVLLVIDLHTQFPERPLREAMHPIWHSKLLYISSDSRECFFPEGNLCPLLPLLHINCDVVGYYFGCLYQCTCWSVPSGRCVTHQSARSSHIFHDCIGHIPMSLRGRGLPGDVLEPFVLPNMSPVSSPCSIDLQLLLLPGSILHSLWGVLLPGVLHLPS